MIHLKEYEKFSVQDLTTKFKAKVRKLGSAIGREAKETVLAGEIFLKIISGKTPSPKEIKFLKEQSLDVVKILSIIGLQAVPGSSVAIAALEVAGKKYGFSVLPQDHMSESLDDKETVSFDFDGVLHVSVEDIHPISFDDHTKWVPFKEMHDKLREEAKTKRVIVVSARPGETLDAVEKFLEKYKLTVDKIYLDADTKVDILVDEKAIKHYDDSWYIFGKIVNTDIEFIKVYPAIKKWEVPSDKIGHWISDTDGCYFMEDQTGEIILAYGKHDYKIYSKYNKESHEEYNYARPTETLDMYETRNR